MNATRLIVWLACLVVFAGSVAWMRSGGSRQPDMPTIALDTLPLELAGYQGQDVAIHDETVRVLHAHSHINRIYRDSLGRALALHAADWLNADAISPAPHHPQVCYPAAGWEIVERRTVVLPRQQLSGDEGWPLELIRFQQAGQSVVTAHWFQVGEIAFVDEAGFQAQRLRFVGMRGWPSTLKVLLQLPAPSIDAAEAPLSEFSEAIIDALEPPSQSVDR